MPVGIVEVMNNTGHVLAYYNQESKYSFELNPAEDVGSADVLIPISDFKDDTVPYKSSGYKIMVSVDGGPQFVVCDDNWKLSVTRNGEAEKWTSGISNGGQYVMLVEPGDVKFLKYNPGLKGTGVGYVAVNSIPAFVSAIANAILQIKF